MRQKFRAVIFSMLASGLLIACGGGGSGGSSGVIADELWVADKWIYTITNSNCPNVSIIGILTFDYVGLDLSNYESSNISERIDHINCVTTSGSRSFFFSRPVLTDWIGFVVMVPEFTDNSGLHSITSDVSTFTDTLIIMREKLSDSSVTTIELTSNGHPFN